MNMRIEDISLEMWDEMEGEEKLSVMEASLAEYVERGIDNAEYDRYGDGTLCRIIICSVYMFEDLATVSNMRWWRESRLLDISGGRSPTADIDGDWCETLTYSEAKDIVRVCNELLDYPIIDEGFYAELEDEAFDASFREEFYECGGLAPEWDDIDEGTLRDIAWQSGGVDGDWYHIDMDYVKDEVRKIRAQMLGDIQMSELQRIEEVQYAEVGQ